jgi:glycosyltransferase involved in cell wall biosynthesis
MYLARTLAAAEAVVAYSDYVASYFRKFNAEAKPIDVIPNGVPPELAQYGDFSSDVNQSGALNIAYCGTVTGHKGPHVILEALRIAELKSVNVHVFGHTPEKDYAKRLRDQAAAVPGLTLKMYGKYERNEVPLLLRGADCVIMPSLVPEAGPIVPREALACGLPVIATKLGAAPEVICEGENGFTFDPTQPEQLAAILRRLVTDPSLLARLRTGARKSQASTLAEHAEQVNKVYDRALRDFEGKRSNPLEARELRTLHETLVRLGCDSSRTQQPS